MSSRIKVFVVEDYNQAMPELRKQGFKPATAKQVAQERLDGALSFDVYYDTATGIFYAGSNQDRFKILPYSSELANITPETELCNGGIQRTNEQYNSRKAKEFTRQDMILGRSLIEEEARNHLGWLAALNNNKALLERLVGRVFKESRDKYHRNEAMAFCLRDVQPNPNILALCLYGLGSGGALAGDNYDLNADAHLVGVREETSPVYTARDLKTAERELDRLNKILNPDQTKNLKSLISKLGK